MTLFVLSCNPKLIALINCFSVMRSMGARFPLNSQIKKYLLILETRKLYTINCCLWEYIVLVIGSGRLLWFTDTLRNSVRIAKLYGAE